MKLNRKFRSIATVTVLGLVLVIGLYLFWALKTGKWSLKADTLHKTYYVDAVNGSDNNDGLSETTAWKTISKVNSSAFQPGEFVLFKKGSIWRERLNVPSSGLMGSPITFSSYSDGNQPVISGADLMTNWINSDTLNVWQSPCAVSPNIVVFNNVPGINKSGKSTLTTAGDWYWSANILYVYSSTNPTTTYRSPGIEAGSRSIAVSLNYHNYIRLENLEISGANGKLDGAVDFNGVTGSINNELSNLTIRNTAGRGINIYGSSNNIVDSTTIYNAGSHGINLFRATTTSAADNNTFSNNTIYQCADYGISLYGNTDTARANNNKVFNNTVYKCGDGVYLNWSDGNDIHDNKLYSNDYRSPLGEGYGVGIQTGSNNLVHNNEIYNNRTRGIELWGGNTKDGAGRQYGQTNGNQIYSNRIYGNGLNNIISGSNEGAGIMFSAPFISNNQIYSNLIYNNARGFYVTSSGTNNKFFNNTVDGNTIYGASIASGITGLTLQNNAFSNNTKQALLIGANSTITHTNNCYYKSDSTAIITLNTTNYSLSQATTFEPTATSADPLFIDRVATNFHLKDVSPIIGKGLFLGSASDFEGKQLSTPPDLGALQFATISSTTPADPTVSLSAPASGATLSDVAILTATATSNDTAMISKVDFYQGTTLLGSSTTSPYTYSWDTSKVTNGTYSLAAKATTSSNASAISSAVLVTISNTVIALPITDTISPTISITNPSSGAKLARLSIVTLTASATDNTKVTKVVFYVNGSLVSTDTASPYSASWKVPKTRKATYKIQAKAYDAAGNIGLSPIITVYSNLW